MNGSVCSRESTASKWTENRFAEARAPPFWRQGALRTRSGMSERPLAACSVVVQPAGLDTFFYELDAATNGMQEPDLSVVVPVFHKHGVVLPGPPLA